MDSDQITHELFELLRRGRWLDADFLVHLVEFDRRRLFIVSGYTSLWDYCTRKLGLPKGVTFRRVTCVALLQRHPPAIDFLRDGRLSMTALVLLKDVLTPENAAEWLERAAGRTCEEIELMVGDARPRPERRDGMRRLPAAPALAEPLPLRAQRGGLPGEGEPPPTALFLPENRPQPENPHPAGPLPTEPAPAEKPAAEAAAAASPAAGRYQFTATGDQELKLLYEKARALLSHKIPRNDPAAVLKLAFAALIEAEEKRRGIGRKPRSASPAKGISAEVTRQIWQRDGGCCSWVMPDRPGSWSATTGCHLRSAADRPPKRSGSCAGSTTSRRRARCSGTRSWTGSVNGTSRAASLAAIEGALAAAEPGSSIRGRCLLPP